MAKIIEITGQLVINPKTREWCKLPYPGHTKGCPNYGKKDDCPPKAPMVDEVFDLSKPHWLIVEEFNLGEFAEKMKEKHPHWSDKQSRCLLYWQGSVRKKLRLALEEFQEKMPDTIYTLLPEAMGVNVFLTAKKVGIKIDKNPMGTVYKIALVGYVRPNLD